MAKTVAETSRHIRKQTTEIMWAAPQVVAHRLGQFALAGVMPNEKDTRELHRMSAEKIAAFSESWNAAGVELLKMQQQVALGFARAMWSPFGDARGQPALLDLLLPSALTMNAALGVLDKSIAPVHRRALANAKRLRKQK